MGGRHGRPRVGAVGIIPIRIHQGGGVDRLAWSSDRDELSRRTAVVGETGSEIGGVR